MLLMFRLVLLAVVVNRLVSRVRFLSLYPENETVCLTLKRLKLAERTGCLARRLLLFISSFLFADCTTSLCCTTVVSWFLSPIGCAPVVVAHSI